MNRLQSLSSRMESRYFDSDIATVQTDGGDIHAVGLTGRDLQTAFDDEDLPEGGVILTPEMATIDLSQGLDSIPDQMSAAKRVESAAKYASMQSPVDIRLGSIASSPIDGKYYNVVKKIQHGMVKDVQIKRDLSGVESVNGIIDRPPVSQRVVDELGRVTLVCSELLTAGSALKYVGDDVNTILLPAAWGAKTPGFDREGDVDSLNRRNLERAVSLAFSDLPNLKRVIVSDRSVDGGRAVSSEHRRIDD